MDVSKITGIVLTFNEEANLDVCLKGLRRLKRVLVVDSYSTDQTTEIAGKYANVEIVRRHFDDFASQYNFAMTQVVSPWILSIDADYRMEENFWKELEEAAESEDLAGLSCRFKFAVYSHIIRGAIYPPRIIVHRSTHCSYYMVAHTQSLRVEGRVKEMRSHLTHDDHKSLDRWALNQIRYSRENAEHALTSGSRRLQDKLRCWMLAPVIVLPYCLLWRGMILGGLPGIFYAFQRLFSECLTCLFVLRSRIAIKDSKSLLM